jgi:hypothetical protein
MLRKMLICLIVVVAVPALAAPPTVDTVPVEIVSAEFGTFDASNPGELLFEPTRSVPHREGQRYGWSIEVRTGKRSVSVREEYLLANPVPAANAAVPENGVLTLPQPRRNQVSQRQLVPVDGMIYGEWAVGPGEPAGHRHLQVVIEEQAVADFEFDVE